MKIQLILSVAVTLLEISPTLSAGLRYGNLATDFDEFLQKARNNNSLKQCKKSCDRTYNKNSRAANRCRTVCDSSYDDWNYFPTGGQCERRCMKDSDCQKGGFNPCGSCGQLEGTEMYQLCYAPKPDEEEKVVITDAQEEQFIESKDNSYSCGKSCRKDSDCWQGGFITCGTCNTLHGTEGFHTCISNDTPAPTVTPTITPGWDFFPEGGQCRRHCKKDSDCQKGGFNPCGSCGQFAGTEMYHLCYAPVPYDDDFQK